jgi:hypothetical protein
LGRLAVSRRHREWYRVLPQSQIDSVDVNYNAVSEASMPS